jgi:hypothetical protein
MMERCITLKAADFKAGVAIPTYFGDGDDNLTKSKACSSMGAGRNGERAAQPVGHQCASQ